MQMRPHGHGDARLAPIRSLCEGCRGQVGRPSRSFPNVSDLIADAAAPAVWLALYCISTMANGSRATTMRPTHEPKWKSPLPCPRRKVPVSEARAAEPASARARMPLVSLQLTFCMSMFVLVHAGASQPATAITLANNTIIHSTTTARASVECANCFDSRPVLLANIGRLASQRRATKREVRWAVAYWLAGLPGVYLTMGPFFWGRVVRRRADSRQDDL